MKNISEMTRLTNAVEGSDAGIYQSSEKCFYIVLPNGEKKFLVKSRLDKLVAKHGGDINAVVTNYRVRNTNKV